MARTLVLRGVRPAGTDRPVDVVVTDGTVVAVTGDAGDAGEAAGRDPVVLDLTGRVVTAGLVDGHSHPVLGTDLTDGVDLSGCRDLAAVRAALHAAPDRAGWLVGWGLDPNAFGDVPLGAAPLADVVGERPAFLRLFDAHSAIASPEALRRAGVTGARSFTARSEVVVDADGRPTGLLLEEPAVALVQQVLPIRSTGERRDRLARVLHAMAATGLTGAHVMDLDDDALELYRALDDDGDLPLRLRLAPWRRPDDDERTVADLVAVQGTHGRLWEVAGAKLFLDGTIDNGTAWLAEPDTTGASAAPYWRDPDAYTRAVHDLAARGVPTATHAIGDAAVAHVVRTVATLPAAARHQGHRIEHLETLPDDLVAAVARVGVAASMQPTHATDFTRADHGDNWSRRLGVARADRGWRCRDLLTAGALLVLGSDWPVAPFDPRVVLAAARLRRPHDRPDLAPVGPDQALTAAEALAGYTSAPAAVAGAHRAGSVAPGARADLTVWDDDPLRVPAADLPHVPIALTVVDGVPRHRAADVG